MFVSEEVAGPFPAPAAPEMQRIWVDAVMLAEGVNLPRAAVESFAPFVVRPEDDLTPPGADGVRRLKGDRMGSVKTDAGEVRLLKARVNGLFGVVWEHNERTSSEWHSAANPAGVFEDKRKLPPVCPWTGVGEDGRERTFAALESKVPNRETLIGNLMHAVEVLESRVGFRTYDLLEDLVLNGQMEPGMYVPQETVLEEEPDVGDDGSPRYPKSYWQCMAVRGNNRTKCRQEIFGISSWEVMTGVPLSKLGQEGDGFSYDPAHWLGLLSKIFNSEYAVARQNNDPDARSVRAKAVAVVEAHLVVGSPTPNRLFRIVQGSNRRDHVHPPLGFGANDRARALGRGVIGKYAAAGVLDEVTAAVLSGAAQITDLDGVPSDATVSVQRDIRSMRLLQELFPTDGRKQALIRRALSEPAPSKLQSAELNQRVRAWSALTSESYEKPWNPRVAEVLQAKAAREGITVSGRPLPELLQAAESDDNALDELLNYRAPHWLAAYDLIDADRGSLQGQHIDDEGKQAQQVRRSVKNALNAMRNKREMAVGLLREIAAAMDDEDRRPCRVDPYGNPTEGEATRAWFNRAFPKETGTRPYNRRNLAGEAVPPAPTAAQATPTAGQEPGSQDGEGGEGADETAPQLVVPMPASTQSVSASALPAPETDAQLLDRLRKESDVQLQALEAGIGDFGGHLIDLRKHAEAMGLDHALGQETGEEAVERIGKMMKALRECRQTVLEISGTD